MSENLKHSDPSPAASAPSRRQGFLDRHILTRSFRRIARMALILIILGLTWRILRYSLAFPLWGDESMVAASLIERNFSTVTRAPLEYGQIAPPLWMIAQLAIKQIAGLSEYSLHFLSFICGIISLPLFWRFARQATNRSAAVLAVGVLAAAFYPVRHSTELKPYASDLLMSLILLLLAWRVRQRPGSIGRWVVLSLFAAGVGWFSYPTIFVAVGVGLFLMYVVAKNRSAKAWAGLATYAVVAGAGVLAMIILYAGPQNANTPGYEEIWRDAFPPSITQPLKLAWWLLDVHTGNMLAYPFGGKNFASSGTTILVIIGCVHLWRRRRRDLLILLLAPLALTFLASIPKRYPYGISARTMLHMAPAFCLLTGVGLSCVIRRLLPRRVIPDAHRVAAIVLAVAIVAGGIANVMKPYKDLYNLQMRADIHKLAEQTSARDTWVVGHAGPNDNGPPPRWTSADGATFRVYSTRWCPGKILWAPSPAKIPADGKVFLFYFDDPQGLDYSVNPLRRDRDARFKQFQPYLADVRKRLGMEYQKVSYPLAPAERGADSQIIQVYEFLGGS